MKFTDWDSVVWEVTKTAATRVPDGVSFETVYSTTHHWIVLDYPNMLNPRDVMGDHLACWTDEVVHKINLLVQKLGQV